MSIIKALVNILGTVACKEKCGPSISVTLLRLADKRNEVRKTVSMTEGSNKFAFSDIIPGKYRLEVCAYSLLYKFLGPLFKFFAWILELLLFTPGFSGFICH